MRYCTPGYGGKPEHHEAPAAVLATAFWASSWGRRASQDPSGAAPDLMGWLTAPASLGGVQASWSDPAGLRELRDFVVSQGARHG